MKKILYLMFTLLLTQTTCWADPLADGDAFLRKGKYKEAEAAYSEFIASNPNNVQGYLKRAYARRGLKDLDNAMVDFNYAVELEPDNAFPLRQRGMVLADSLKQYDRALEDLNRSIELNPNDNITFTFRGRCLMKKEKLEEALMDFDRSIELKGDYYYSHSSRGEVLEKLGRKKEALESYKKVLEIQPNNRTAKRRIKELGGDTAQKKDKPPEVKKPEVPKRRVFRLFQSNMTYKEQDFIESDYTIQYEGEGTEAGFKTRMEGPDGFGTTRIQWKVPAELIPGKPARFTISGERDGYYGGTYGHIELKKYSQWIMAGVRVTDNPYAGPDQKIDTFDFIFPDIGQAPEEYMAGKGDREVVMKMRNRERMFGSVQNLPMTYEDLPRDIPIEEVSVPLSSWVVKDKKESRLYDITVTVYWSTTRFPVATYHYKAVELDEPDNIEFQTDPSGIKELRADGRDYVLLKARAKEMPGVDTKEATRSIVFKPEGEGSQWLDLGTAEMRGEWKAVRVKASNPDAARGSKNLPAELSVRANGKSGDQEYTGVFTLKVPSEPVIDVVPDRAEFVSKSGGEIKVRVEIENGGARPWSFRTEYADNDRPLANVKIDTDKDGQSAVITLTEAGLDPANNNTSNEVSVLCVLAEQQDRDTLERRMKIIVGQEGLYISTVGRVPEGEYYRVTADGTGKTTDVDFSLFTYDKEAKSLVNSSRELDQITITSMEPEDSVAAQALKTGNITHRFAGLRAANDPSGIIRFSLANEIPGDGRIIPCDFKAAWPGREEENFTTVFTLGLVTTSNGPGSEDWQVELENCREIINKFIPPSYHVRMYDLLNRRKMTLGADGLKALRDRIWRSAVELTLGEGGKGYANEAAWANYITETLEWAEWAGDMAFGAVIGTWTGPYGSVGAGMLKTAVISAVNAYQEGTSPDEWLRENLSTIPGVIEGEIINPETFEAMGMESKAKVWAVYIAYHFCKNLYNGDTLVDALKNTAKEAGSNVLSNWLGECVEKNSAKEPASDG